MQMAVSTLDAALICPYFLTGSQLLVYFEIFFGVFIIRAVLLPGLVCFPNSTVFLTWGLLETDIYTIYFDNPLILGACGVLGL